MLERIFNFLLNLDSIFTRSREPFIEMVRQQQRLIVCSMIVAIGALVVSFFIAPPVQANGLIAMLSEIRSTIALIFAVVSAIAAVVLLFASYRLWKLVDYQR